MKARVPVQKMHQSHYSSVNMNLSTKYTIKMKIANFNKTKWDFYLFIK